MKPGPIIPDELAEEIAENLFGYYNELLDRAIDIDLLQYDFYGWQKKPYWHYKVNDYFRIRFVNKFTDEIQTDDRFPKNNGYMSCSDHYIYTNNVESVIKVLECLTSIFVSEYVDLIYNFYYRESEKCNYLEFWVILSQEEKPLRAEKRSRNQNPDE